MDSHHLRYPLPAAVKVQDDNSGKVNHKLEIFSEQGFRARPPIRRSLLERPNSKKTGKKHSKMSILDSDLPPDIFFLVQGEDEESGELRRGKTIGGHRFILAGVSPVS